MMMRKIDRRCDGETLTQRWTTEVDVSPQQMAIVTTRTIISSLNYIVNATDSLGSELLQQPSSNLYHILEKDNLSTNQVLLDRP